MPVETCKTYTVEHNRSSGEKTKDSVSYAPPSVQNAFTPEVQDKDVEKAAVSYIKQLNITPNRAKSSNQNEPNFSHRQGVEFEFIKSGLHHVDPVIVPFSDFDDEDEDLKENFSNNIDDPEFDRWYKSYRHKY